MSRLMGWGESCQCHQMSHGRGCFKEAKKVSYFLNGQIKATSSTISLQILISRTLFYTMKINRKNESKGKKERSRQNIKKEVSNVPVKRNLSNWDKGRISMITSPVNFTKQMVQSAKAQSFSKWQKDAIMFHQYLC